ncbi:MAG: heme NO-binding domain-containing protein [Polyangiales bacterium]
MKGTIAKCLEEMVRTTHGDDKWRAVLETAGMKTSRVFMTTEDVPDGEVLGLIGATSKVLGVSNEQTMEAFGDHWSTKYAPSIYGVYFDKATNARDFLLSLHEVHQRMTRTVKNAAPPNFTYDASNPKRLVMKYGSARGLVALMPGLVRGVAKYYKERVNVALSGNDVVIDFLS